MVRHGEIWGDMLSSLSEARLTPAMIGTSRQWVPRRFREGSETARGSLARQPGNADQGGVHGQRQKVAEEERLHPDHLSAPSRPACRRRAAPRETRAEMRADQTGSVALSTCVKEIAPRPNEMTPPTCVPASRMPRNKNYAAVEKETPCTVPASRMPRKGSRMWQEKYGLRVGQQDARRREQLDRLERDLWRLAQPRAPEKKHVREAKEELRGEETALSSAERIGSRGRAVAAQVTVGDGLSVCVGRRREALPRVCLYACLFAAVPPKSRRSTASERPSARACCRYCRPEGAARAA